MFFTFQRILLFLALAAAVVLVIYDINRAQPWFYIYWLMTAVYIFYNGRVDDSNNYTSFFIMLQVIFASVYFFCGFNQLNCLFIHTDYTEVISPLKSILSERQFGFFIKMGVMVPYILMFIGIGFIVSAMRYLAISLAIILHVLLLVFLFPDNSGDYALWLSNLSFIIILLLLFSGKTKQRYFSPTFLFRRPLFYLVFILCVILPFFNNSGKWPDFFSFNIKSGNNQKAIIAVSADTYSSIKGTSKLFFKPYNSVMMLDYNAWCRYELRSECFPDKRVFNSILATLDQSASSNVKEIELSLPPKQPLLCKQ
jgi:hypothetical protein